MGQGRERSLAAAVAPTASQPLGSQRGAVAASQLRLDPASINRLSDPLSLRSSVSAKLA